MLGVRLTFAPLPLEWLAIVAAVLALAWEWVRWGFLRVPASQRIIRIVLAIVAAGPVALGAGWLLARSSAWAVGILAGCGVVWAIRSYAQTTSPISRRARKVLLGLRIGIILLLFLVVAQPAMEHVFSEPVRMGLAILVDTSKSMARTDAPGNYAKPDADTPDNLSRLASAQQALEDQQVRLRKLSQRYKLRVVGFDGDLRDRPAGQLQPVGDVTAIGDNVQSVLDEFLTDKLDVAGVCVLTDGCNNTSDVIDPITQAESLASRGLPLWTLGIGRERSEQIASLNVRSVQAPDEIDAMDTLQITADVEATGLAGQSVTLECRLGDVTVGEATATFSADTQKQAVRFSAKPTKPGFHRLTVTARPPDVGQRTLVGQFQASRLVHVLNRSLRVLYVEGRRRYENKFLAQALGGAQRFKVDRWILTDPASDSQPGGLDAAQWEGYHVVILGDCQASAFTGPQLERIRQMVAEQGKGLVMIGGRDSFAAGGWADTPLAEVLPVDVAASQGELPGPLAVVPTPEGLACEAMQIAEDSAHAAAWSKLRPLSGANVLGSPKLGAVVLARSPAGQAMIVMQNFGAGRSMAIAFDTTWQWVLSPEDTADLQKRFWRQTMLWLANPTPNAWVATDQTSYDQRRLASGSSAIEVSAGVEDSAGQPLTDLPVSVTLLSPGGNTTPVPLSVAGKIRTARLPALPAGEYTLKLDAQAEGKKLQASHKFEVAHRDLESLDVAANLELLRQMGRSASPAGGGYEPLSNLGNVLESFLSGKPVQYRDRYDADDLVGRHLGLLLFALLAGLMAEWVIRKRVGLV